MSNDNALISSGKGALGVVWLAAHWDKKLNRATVVNHNITLSVKVIMEPKNVYTLRISGFLLLGLAKLLDKKVDKILEETDHILDDVMQSSKDAVIILKSLGITAVPNRIKIARSRGRRVPAHFDNVGSIDLSSSIRKDVRASRIDNSRYLARHEDITLPEVELRAAVPDISTRLRGRNADLEYSDSFLRDVEQSLSQNTKKRMSLKHEPGIGRISDSSPERDILGEPVLGSKNKPPATHSEIGIEIEIDQDQDFNQEIPPSIEVPQLTSDPEESVQADIEMNPTDPEPLNPPLDIDELDEAMTIHHKDIVPEYIIQSDPEEEERIRDLNMLMDLDDPPISNTVIDNSLALVPIKLNPEEDPPVISAALPDIIIKDAIKQEVKKEINEKFRSRRVNGLWREDLCTNIEDYEDTAGMDETHDIIRNTSYYIPHLGLNVEDAESIFFTPIVKGMAPELDEFYTSNLKLVRLKRAVYEENHLREREGDENEMLDHIYEPEISADLDIDPQANAEDVLRAKRPREEAIPQPEEIAASIPVASVDQDEVIIKKIKKEEDDPVLPSLPEIPIKKEDKPPEGPKLAIRTLKLLKLLHKKFETSATVSYFRLLENVHKRSTAAKSFYELMILSNKDLVILTQEDFFEDIGIWDRPRHNIII